MWRVNRLGRLSVTTLDIWAHRNLSQILQGFLTNLHDIITKKTIECKVYGMVWHTEKWLIRISVSTCCNIAHWNAFLATLLRTSMGSSITNGWEACGCGSVVSPLQVTTDRDEADEKKYMKMCKCSHHSSGAVALSVVISTASLPLAVGIGARWGCWR